MCHSWPLWILPCALKYTGWIWNILLINKCKHAPFHFMKGSFLLGINHTLSPFLQHVTFMALWDLSHYHTCLKEQRSFIHSQKPVCVWSGQWDACTSFFIRWNFTAQQVLGFYLGGIFCQEAKDHELGKWIACWRPNFPNGFILFELKVWNIAHWQVKACSLGTNYLPSRLSNNH